MTLRAELDILDYLEEIETLILMHGDDRNFNELAINQLKKCETSILNAIWAGKRRSEYNDVDTFHDSTTNPYVF